VRLGTYDAAANCPAPKLTPVIIDGGLGTIDHSVRA